jgi:hypothetical protein
MGYLLSGSTIITNPTSYIVRAIAPLSHWKVSPWVSRNPSRSRGGKRQMGSREAVDCAKTAA